MNQLDKSLIFQCVSDLRSVTVSHSENCVTGYFDYTEVAWEEWMKKFASQSGTCFKMITGEDVNKQLDKGVLSKDEKLEKYSVKWSKVYNCHRGGKARYKHEADQPAKASKVRKSRNAPGSRLMDCKATINTRLIVLESGSQILEVKLPLPSAHTNHSPSSLADLQSHKPLPEIYAKVESLITHSHLSQISLMLALKDWINHELIPQHLQQGILSSKPSEYDWRYYPTSEDLKNMSRKVVHKIRNNMFDQDALDKFLCHEAKNGFKFFLRKYVGEPSKDSNWRVFKLHASCSVLNKLAKIIVSG